MTDNRSPFPAFKDWVPKHLRFWIYLLFLLLIQFANGMYFSAMNQMSGGLSLTMNDVKMLSHAMLIGQTMFFPLAFRFKTRFTGRNCLMFAALGLAVCNLLVPHTHSMPLLVLLCFIGGFLRLFGTFECLSSLLPKIAPTHNYAVFLSFVFFIVLGTIHLFDWAGAQIIYYYRWEYLHYASVGFLGVVFWGAWILMRPWRFMPMQPLLGLDGFGFVLWSIFILSLIYVAQYGYQLGWLHSPHIRAALGASCIALGVNIARMTYYRHPFLDLAAFKTRKLSALLLLFLVLGVLLSTKNMLQNTFTYGLLHMDLLSNAKLKWFEFLGAAAGTGASWYALSRKKEKPYKRLTFTALAAVTAYMSCMYFLISPATNMEKLYFPLFCCGFGHLMFFITLTVYAQATAPFKNYFQVLCVLGLIRTGLASPIGDAIYTTALQGLLSKQLATFSPSLLSVLPSSVVSASALANTLQSLFGWSVLAAVSLLVGISFMHFKGAFRRAVPSLRSLYLKIYASRQ